MTNIVVGIDGHKYKPLSLQEAKSLCCDIPFYLRIDYGGGNVVFEQSRITTEDYRRRGRERLDAWYEYPPQDPYYIRVDGDDKPEYTPNDEELNR